MTITSIDKWHKRARPSPTQKDLNVQLGCHFEEIAEMVEMVSFHTPGFDPMGGTETIVHHALDTVARMLKSGEMNAHVINRKEFLDSLAYQIVTAAGVGHCAGMDVPGAVEVVDHSNWSKFVDGEPVFDNNGKITKGPDYFKPDLEGFY